MSLSIKLVYTGNTKVGREVLRKLNSVKSSKPISVRPSQTLFSVPEGKCTSSHRDLRTHSLLNAMERIAYPDESTLIRERIIYVVPSDGGRYIVPIKPRHPARSGPIVIELEGYSPEYVTGNKGVRFPVESISEYIGRNLNSPECFLSLFKVLEPVIQKELLKPCFKVRELKELPMEFNAVPTVMSVFGMQNSINSFIKRLPFAVDWDDPEFEIPAEYVFGGLYVGYGLQLYQWMLDQIDTYVA